MTVASSRFTLGVDLAAQDAGTASCVVEWSDGRATVQEPIVGASNAEILDRAAAVAAVGLDAPFGWPEDFVTAVSAWADGAAWPPAWRDDDADARLTVSRRLRLRQTDHVVRQQTRKWPLSVSADSIAVCAMRAAALLTAAAPAPATGETALDRIDGPWFEVYPGAALVAWDLLPLNETPPPGVRRTSYKRDRNVRGRLLEDLVARSDDRLHLGDRARDRCITSDHAFDALLCALVARAAALGRTHPPTDAQRLVAAREGWIHLPPRGAALADLFDP